MSGRRRPLNLRSRLLAVAVAVVALIVVLLIGIVMRQRVVLTDQVDDQLELVADAMIRRVGNRNDPPLLSPTGEGTDASTGDIYPGSAVDGHMTGVSGG